MLLTVRAVHRVACEVVSLIRRHYAPKRLRDDPGPHIDEPVQDDAWVSFRFPVQGHMIDCTVAWIPDGDDGVYAFQFSEPRGCLGFLVKRKPRPLPPALHETMRAVLGGSKHVEVDRWLSDEEYNAMV